MESSYRFLVGTAWGNLVSTTEDRIFARFMNKNLTI